MDNSLHNLIMDSCMDESVKINQHLDLLAEENSASLRRQIAALEDISNHTKDQANSLKEHVDLLTEQVNIAHQNAIDAKKDAIFSRVISIISLLISFLAFIFSIIQSLQMQSQKLLRIDMIRTKLEYYQTT